MSIIKTSLNRNVKNNNCFQYFVSFTLKTQPSNFFKYCQVPMYNTMIDT